MGRGRNFGTAVCLRGIVFVRDSCFAGLAFFAACSSMHQIVRWVVKRYQLQIGLQSELRICLKRGDLSLRERSEFRRVERFDKCPLQLRHVNGEAMTAPGVLGMSCNPRGKFGAKVAQRERAAGMLGEISDAESIEFTVPDDGAQRWKIFGESAEHAIPILPVVDFETLKGREPRVRRNE